MTHWKEKKWLYTRSDGACMYDVYLLINKWQSILYIILNSFPIFRHNKVMVIQYNKIQWFDAEWKKCHILCSLSKFQIWKPMKFRSNIWGLGIFTGQSEVLKLTTFLTTHPTFDTGSPGQVSGKLICDRVKCVKCISLKMHWIYESYAFVVHFLFVF